MKNTYPTLTKAWEKGCAFLGTETALLGGAMSWISERHLVAATSNAGAFGVIAGGSMPPDLLEKEIIETRKLTDKPFGVNLITMHPQLDELIDRCLKQNVSHVVLAGGLPTADSIKRLKEGGAKVICFAPALALAKKMIRSGADALVVEGSEAGGHIGPVATSILVQEILPAITDVPVFVAGGIGHGDMIAAFLRMGAAGCQVGTHLVCAEECIAHENFKRAMIRANARDALPTVQLDPRFPVIPVRALVNKGTEAFMQCQRDMVEKFQKGDISQKDAQLEIEHFWAGALKKAAIDGDIENGSVMAGQSVGLIKKVQPMKDIFESMLSQAENALSA